MENAVEAIEYIKSEENWYKKILFKRVKLIARRVKECILMEGEGRAI